MGVHSELICCDLFIPIQLLRTSCVTPRRYQPWKGPFFAQSWGSARAHRASRVHRHQQKNVPGRTGCGSLSRAARDSPSRVLLLALPAANSLALPEINAHCSCAESGVSLPDCMYIRRSIPRSTWGIPSLGVPCSMLQEHVGEAGSTAGIAPQSSSHATVDALNEHVLCADTPACT